MKRLFSIFAALMAVLSSCASIPAAAQMPPPATTPLSGSNIIYCYQGTILKSCLVSDIAGLSSGTVTSVGLSLPSIFTVTVSPVTTTGTLTATLNNQSPSTVLVGNISTPPSFRILNGGDVIYKATGTGSVNLTQQTQNGYYLLGDSWGADPTGTNDSQTAITAAFAATTGTLRLKGTYRLSSTLQVPPGRGLNGDLGIGANTPLVTKIVCDIGVTPCVQMGDGSSGAPTSLMNISITRASGTPATTAIGILVNAGNNVVINNVQSYSHGVCLKLQGGLGFMSNQFYTGACRDAHVVIDSWAEARWQEGRFGVNGAGDYAADAYIRIQGGGTGAAGPNTISFVNNQFNEGTNGVTNGIEFVGLTGTPDNVEYNFIGNHFEFINTAVIQSDSSWTIINRLTMIGNQFSTNSATMFALNAATQPNLWNLTDNDYFVSTFNLAPTPAIGGLSIKGGYVLGTMSITGTSGSNMSISGLIHSQSETLAGTWGYLSTIGEQFLVGVQTMTANGNIFQGNGVTHFVAGGASRPTISSCGVTPVIDSTSSDNGGVVVIGSGTVTACTVTYQSAFPNAAFPTVNAAITTAPTHWISSYSRTGFTVIFASNAAGDAFTYTVNGR